MTDDTLEQWWEEDNVIEFGDGVVTLDRSILSITTWGDAGWIGVSYLASDKDLDAIIRNTFQALHSFKRADEWISLMRQAHISRNVLTCIQESEKLLYSSQTSMNLNPGFYASDLNQLYFHMFRAYARAEEGNFDDAQLIWTEIVHSWMDHADEYRQPFILFHLYVTSLCTKDWKNSMSYLDQLWALIKFMDANKRHAFGIWDEWVACLLVTWFFIKHCPTFSVAFRKECATQSDLFKFQKKSLILEHLDPAFITSLVDLSYYNKAREMFPHLPQVQYKEKSSASPGFTA